MTFVEAFGWFSAALSLVTFSMKTMIPLRTAAICSNMASITYSLLLGLYPGVVLNALLLGDVPISVEIRGAGVAG